MKYLKYYISTITLIIAFHVCFLGEYYPTIFFFCFSLFIILGDLVVREDSAEKQYSKIYLLNLPMYLNFPLLTIILLISAFMLGDVPQNAFTNIISAYLNINILEVRDSLNIYDSVSYTHLTLPTNREV